MPATAPSIPSNRGSPQMGAVIGEGGTSFLLAEFFGVSNIDELEGADVFSALEKFDKLQP